MSVKRLLGSPMLPLVVVPTLVSLLVAGCGESGSLPIGGEILAAPLLVAYVWYCARRRHGDDGAE
jgi:hypothetical protein